MGTSRTKAIILFVAILALSAMVFAGNAKPFGMGQTRTLTFTENTIIGNAVLPAGDYKVQHVMEGEQHVLIFKAIGKKAEARVNCKMEQTNTKADQSIQLFKVGPNGEKVLTTLVFRGDTYKHIVAE